MRHWTRRFTLEYSKVGQALNASNAELNKDFLLENIRGILLAETSGLTSSEFASVLATSGTTGAEGESIGNSWKFSHLVEAFCTQWCDAALAARDAKARVFRIIGEVDAVLQECGATYHPLGAKKRTHTHYICSESAHVQRVCVECERALVPAQLSGRVAQDNEPSHTR